ncbi:chitinase [Cryobacterium sp. PAMC25264]|uniref:chitinase n=1 Tax=Cryobacterium sp. PAMC25264 TaxID=2861288 RepID=UPI001C630AAF|nr:glycosyl hydrolase family 18 protein [Cryobacterium sp. PAMC25264]QYF74357.1 glycosyl hydrolase family 18 [Cryobacterium sp. PAMC25264]
MSAADPGAAAPVTPTAPVVKADRPRRRLSVVRVFLGIVLVVALSAGGYLGWQWWGSAQAAEAYDPWFAGYVDVTATPTYDFEATADLAGNDVVLSFIVAAADDACAPSWGTHYSLDEASDELDLDRRLARVKQLGGQIVVSFGGLLNTELGTGCTDKDALIAAYAAVLDRYDVTTIDLDLEGANLTDPAAAERRATAIAELQADRRAAGKDLAVWLTLPVATGGLTEDGTNAVSAMLDAQVDLAGVNLMTMDFGSSKDADETMADASIRGVTAAHRQIGTLYSRAGTELTDATVWQKIGITPMVGQNDVAGEIFDLDDAKALNTFAQEQKVGRMSLWSLNRDTTCGSNYADVKRVSDSCSGIDQGDEKFVSLLGDGFTGRPVTAAAAVTTDEAEEIGSIVDDPATSPYAIWAAESSYLEGTKVVWHKNVYQTKWWTRGDLPDNPVLNEWETPWVLIGPVMPGETPIPRPTLPVGTYPDWQGTAVYEKNAMILFDGVPYESKWWNQGESPDAAAANPDGSPWAPLSDAEVKTLLDALPK